MLRHESVHGLQNVRDTDITRIDCLPCIEGHMIKPHAPYYGPRFGIIRGQSFSADLAGPLLESLSGNVYFMIIKEININPVRPRPVSPILKYEIEFYFLSVQVDRKAIIKDIDAFSPYTQNLENDTATWCELSYKGPKQVALNGQKCRGAFITKLTDTGFAFRSCLNTLTTTE